MLPPTNSVSKSVSSGGCRLDADADRRAHRPAALRQELHLVVRLAVSMFANSKTEAWQGPSLEAGQNHETDLLHGASPTMS